MSLPVVSADGIRHTYSAIQVSTSFRPLYFTFAFRKIGPLLNALLNNTCRHLRGGEQARHHHTVQFSSTIALNFMEPGRTFGGGLGAGTP
jgi:hypothetical protein